MQRKKFIDEDQSLMQQISKLQELLSSKKHILQVRLFSPIKAHYLLFGLELILNYLSGWNLFDGTHAILHDFLFFNNFQISILY